MNFYKIRIKYNATGIEVGRIIDGENYEWALQRYGYDSDEITILSARDYVGGEG